MQLLFRKAAAITTLVLFLIPSAASAATLEGSVISLDSQAPGLWKVVVKSASGEITLIISTATAIQKEVPVESLKAGDRLVNPGGGSPGVKGLKDPFAGMSDTTKKALGLPNIPNIPPIPPIPKIPPIPDKNQMLKGNGPAPQGGGGPAGGSPAGPAGATPGMGMGGGMAAPKKPPAEAPKVKTQDEMLQEKGFQHEKLLFPPNAGTGKPGDEVTQVNKTDLGFEVTVVSGTGKPEKQTYAPGKKVLKVLSIKDIKKKDKVSLDFNDKDKTVTELQVKG